MNVDHFSTYVIRHDMKCAIVKMLLVIDLRLYEVKHEN